MMLSSQAPPQAGVTAPAGGPHTPAMHHLPPTGSALPPTSPQIAYEGRVSLLSNHGGGAGHHHGHHGHHHQGWPHPSSHFNQFNFNLLHHQFNKQKDVVGGGGSSDDAHPHTDRETSPSSAGSPRTDDTIDKSSERLLDRSQEELLEKSFERHAKTPTKEREQRPPVTAAGLDDEELEAGSEEDTAAASAEKSSLEILEEHIRQIPKPGQPASSSPEPESSSPPPMPPSSPPSPTEKVED